MFVFSIQELTGRQRLKKCTLFTFYHYEWVKRPFQLILPLKTDQKPFEMEWIVLLLPIQLLERKIIQNRCDQHQI